MLKFVVAFCLATAALAQYVEPQKAKILKEQRFNAGDGRFGAAYAQEDGTVYREETSADGERVGQYSYIDQQGKTITVRYSAGKDGFKILEGDHVPLGANGQNSAPYVATQAPRRVQQQPQQQPQQRAQRPQQQFAQQTQQDVSTDYDYYEDLAPTSNVFVQSQPAAPVQQNFAPARQTFAPAQPAANTNPFVNPFDSTHSDFRYNVNGGAYSGRPNGASAVPPCADCAGVNPFINPFDSSHTNPQAFAARPTQAPRQTFQQPQQTFQQPQQTFQQPQQTFQQPIVTEAPRNFFPPGKLQLNRFENGFNFDFTSQ